MAQAMAVTPVSTASLATCDVVRSSKAAPVAVPASGTRRPTQPLCRSAYELSTWST